MPDNILTIEQYNRTASDARHTNDFITRKNAFAVLSRHDEALRAERDQAREAVRVLYDAQKRLAFDDDFGLHEARCPVNHKTDCTCYLAELMTALAHPAVQAAMKAMGVKHDG